jgi:hypothetical protein
MHLQEGKRLDICAIATWLGFLFKSSTVVAGQINPDWDCLQANHMSISIKIGNLICSGLTLDEQRAYRA